MKTKKILTSELVPGMVIAEDVYTFNSQLIIAKNTTLSDRSITRLKFYSIMNVLVILDEKTNNPINYNTNLSVSAQIPKKEQKKQEINYKKEIMSSIEYKKFNESFESSTKQLKNNLEQFVVNNQVNLDSDLLLSDVKQVLSESRNGMHVFNMLHCMRDYNDLTYTHSFNVAMICNVMGEWLKFTKEETDILTMAGLLHDLGKMKMPKEIIEKPSTLSEAEFSIIKTHPLQGYNMIKDLNIDDRIKSAALMHHERCDGSGYPNRLTASEIEPFAKIVAIADTYDAMTCARIYRPALCPFEVISIFEKEGLQKYEPHYLLSFLEGIVETYIHNNVKLSDGRIGEIILINKRSLAKPIVKIEDKFIDLSKEKALSIREII